MLDWVMQRIRCGVLKRIRLGVLPIPISGTTFNPRAESAYKGESCYAAYDYCSMCGPAGRLQRAGLAWDFYWTTWAALRSIRVGSRWDYIEGLTGASRGPDLVGPGRLTFKLLRHRDYGIGRPSGIFPPAHHWDGYPSKVVRHLTRRATRPFRVGGAGLSSGLLRWRTRKRTDAGGPSGAMDT
jgi:hypothetical protein